MMSIDGFRVPLQEQKAEINTPVPFKSQKITTPPGSTSNLKRKHHAANLETPIKNYDFDGLDHINVNRNLMLSPAFSSPQNQAKYNGSNGVTSFQYLKPSHQPLETHHNAYNSSPPPSQANLSSNLSSFDDEFEGDKPKKKKVKKDKKVFDIQSCEKPPYSYATLIGMSILSHPDKRLTLSSIYQWISDTFKYYKKEDVGWQNSIRHNLSLNKAFIKGEKSKDGKGHFWGIEDGCEDQFLKMRNNKKSSYQEIMEQIQIHNKNESNNHDQAQTQKGSQYANATEGAQGIHESHNNFDSQRKRAMYSLPSSPNYYESNGNLTFSRLSSAADYHRQTTKGKPLEGDGDAETHDQSPDKDTDLDVPFNHSWPLSPQQVKVEKQQDLLSTPKFVVSESPNKPLLAGKSLTFTSSFSCNSNLELSPIRPNETGPLLEPLTPGRIYKPGAINHHLNNFQYPAGHQLFTGSSQNQFSSNTQAQTLAVPSNQSQLSSNIHTHSRNQSQSNNEINEAHKVKQPQSQQQQQQNISQSNYLQPTISHSRSYSGTISAKTPKAAIVKTPMRILKTPQTNLKKLWNSPGYLDDFYYSPLITSQSALHSYDDDDMILRAFESPANTYKKYNTASLDTSRVLFHDRKLSVDKSSIDKIDEK